MTHKKVFLGNHQTASHFTKPGAAAIWKNLELSILNELWVGKLERMRKWKNKDYVHLLMKQCVKYMWKNGIQGTCVKPSYLRDHTSRNNNEF